VPIKKRALQAPIDLTPLLLSPLILFALAEGWVDFGGAEKDVLLIVPYLIWALTFFVCANILILKRWLLIRWIKCSFAIATSLLLALAAVVYITSRLGVL